MAKKQKRNQSDATLRNVQASNRRDKELAARIARAIAPVKRRVAALEVLARTLESGLSELRDLVDRQTEVINRIGPDKV